MAKQKKLSVTSLQEKAKKLLSKGELPGARDVYQQACELAPEDASVWFELAETNWKLGDIQAAEKACRQALSLDQNLYQAHINLGQMAVSRGEWALAEKHQRAYLSSQPNNVKAYLDLGLTLERQGKLEESEQLYRQALSLDNTSAELHTVLSRVLRDQGRLDEASNSLECALRSQPDFAQIYCEMGCLFRARKQYDVALKSFHRFAQLAPQKQKSFLFHATEVLIDQERYEDALNYYDKALSVMPQEADIRYGRAQLLLSMGRLDEGWREQEWRLSWPYWQRDHAFGYDGLRPLWQGEPLQGKKILVYAEQGYGDTIQFSRYLPMLSQMGGAVYFHCRSELYELFASSFPGLAGIATNDIDKVVQSEYDYYVPIMSLARFFSPTIDSIPSETPYLHVDNKRLAYWRERLPQDRFKVGVVWAGAGNNPRDKRRSLHVQNLAPLANIKEVEWYSLQKWTQSQSLIHDGVPLVFTNLGGDIYDFSDTAAIIKNLDLVICVDTSVAHLAGALGCPTWVLIYNGPDWRWLRGRQDSPWYSTMRLFRQGVGEEWMPVVERVASALKEEAVAKSTKLTVHE